MPLQYTMRQHRAVTSCFSPTPSPPLTFTRMQGPAEKKHFDSADWAQELDSAEALPLTTAPPELAAS